MQPVNFGVSTTVAAETGDSAVPGSTGRLLAVASPFTRVTAGLRSGTRSSLEKTREDFKRSGELAALGIGSGRNVEGSAMTSPVLGLMYLKSALSSDDVGAFRQLVDPEGQKLQLMERDDAGTYAALEWLLPTAAIVYIGKAYFEGLLKEMGKDHYALLKEGIKGLRAKLFRPGAPQYTLIGSKGKVQADRSYSLIFSMLAEGREGISFKLLLPHSGDQAECEAAVEAFLEFLAAYHTGLLDVTTISELEAGRVVGRTVLLAYEPGLKRLQPVDPFRDVR